MYKKNVIYINYIEVYETQENEYYESVFVYHTFKYYE